MSLRVGLDARLAARGLGISTMVVEVARRLASEVELVWYGDSQPAPPGVSQIRTLRGPFPLLDSPIGRAIARADRLDVMHFAANAGWLKPSAIPTVLTIHDLIFMQADRGRAARQVLGHRYLRFVVPRAARSATALTAPSRTSAQAVEARFGREVRVVPNGVWRPQMSFIGEGNDVLVFAGRDPRKGTVDAIQAWRESGIDRRLVVLAGAGLPPDFDAAAGSDVTAGRIVVREYMPRDRLWQELSRGFALLHMSRLEGFGLPVLEAMAVGVPVIGGLAEASLEIAGEALLKLDRRDPIGSAAAALRRLDLDANLRAGMSAMGLLQAEAHDWDRTAAGYLHVYRDVSG